MLRLAYLSLYNLYCLFGWAYILFLTVNMVVEKRVTDFWKDLEMPLKYVQTAAVMEIIHAVLGLVRSPVSRTLPQVASRLFIVWLFMDHLHGAKDPATASSRKSSMFATEKHCWFGIMCTIAWSCVEIIRSSFYGLNTIDAKLVPFPLIWLRYSAFIVLYPLGVSGEMLTAYATLPLLAAADCPKYLGGCPPNPTMLLYVFLCMYVPGLPFLYMSMLGERKKRLYPKPVPKPSGIVFPVTKKGDRSTTTTAKEVFAAAIGAVDPEAAKKASREKNWRFGYHKHIYRSMVVGAKSEEAALKVAKAGLDHMYSSFDHIKADGTSVKLAQAKQERKNIFHTATIKGARPKASRPEIKVPYKCFHTGKYTELKGQALIEQIDRWVSWGTIEPDCGEAIKDVVKNPLWSDLSGQYFVVLGTTSAMGPFLLLKELGAHIIAVDLDRPVIWKKIIEGVQESSATVTFPMKEKFTNQSGEELYQLAGCNLMTQAPEIAAWVSDTVPVVCKGKPVTIGGYAYLDGELHVRVNLACDMIMQTLIEAYGAKNVRLANLCTPTDCYLIPERANRAARDNLKKAPVWQSLLQAVLGPMGKLVPNALKPIKSDKGEELHLMDALVIAQGPNYAMAKRLQQWRAVLARKEGCTVSINIAPATATASVVSNKGFAAAYGGMHVFKPMEIFYQEVSNAVMGMLLIYDISSPNSPAKPTFKLTNPQEIFAQNAFHGGAMRCLYKFTSIGEIAALVNYAKTYGMLMAVGGVAVAAAAVAFVSQNQ
uniref:very-long-chain (3R)-3-hydroxyacyl-CoA dehydratase n=1 Tax=Hemiselmis andersenii TaxID=464988 RepID=A0A6U2CT40_HEMAN|mmetsp:Transcript_22172/g.51484  ORF Transcript_22172/g.51484 Transcript_22172/m.51484 type:complete len:766 (+) Transcript_22172:41-2338(+)